MKYETPTYEITGVETTDVIAASPDIVVNEITNVSANYLVDFWKLF